MEEAGKIDVEKEENVENNEVVDLGDMRKDEEIKHVDSADDGENQKKAKDDQRVEKEEDDQRDEKEEDDQRVEKDEGTYLRPYIPRSSKTNHRLIPAVNGSETGKGTPGTKGRRGVKKSSQ